MKCKSCGEEMSGKRVREGFAPEGKLPPEREKYTCKNKKCSGFDKPITGRTFQETKDLAQARLKADYPKAILVVDGSKGIWFNHDTWIIELQHENTDVKESGVIYFGYAIRDDQTEEEAHTWVSKTPLDPNNLEPLFQRT
ncbi:MAG: hypothetical protein ABSF63_12910 [Candidatus Bathyarchaeia archaeon]|jgi:hypothetical protein